MTTEFIKNISRFILLVLLQVVIVQNIDLSSYVILFPYVLFILMLPFETNKHIVLFSSFIIGVSIDYFYNTSGIHASACTSIGFMRHYVLQYIAPRDGYDKNVEPSIHDMGLEWFLRYAGTMILVHHLFVFYLEIFHFSEFFTTFFRSLMSSIGTFILIYLIQMVFITRQSRT